MLFYGLLMCVCGASIDVLLFAVAFSVGCHVLVYGLLMCVCGASIVVILFAVAFLWVVICVILWFVELRLCVSVVVLL